MKLFNALIITLGFLWSSNACSQRILCFEHLTEDSTQINEEQPLLIVSVMPAFKTCDTSQSQSAISSCTQKAITDHILQNFSLPKDTIVSGRVFAQFTVSKKGKVTKVVILKGLSIQIDNEVVRVISSLPSFYPGRNLGKKAAVLYTIPFHISSE